MEKSEAKQKEVICPRCKWPVWPPHDRPGVQYWIQGKEGGHFAECPNPRRGK